MYNSTIRQKMGQCELCPESKGRQPLTGKLCHMHYWQSVKMKSVQKQLDRETETEEDFPDLVAQADRVFSTYVRMKAANKTGILTCFICNSPVRWQDGQAMHFVKRGNLFLRWDERNVKAGDKACNEYKGGNYLMYVKQLEKDRPGITDILMEESRLAYKPTRDEIRSIITDYTQRIKLLNK
jgi:hypothetical protein